MRAYSTDLRERIVRAVANGQPMRGTARQFGVHVATVKRLVVRYQQTGMLTPRRIPGGQRHIGATQEVTLRERLAAAPDATVLEHCAWWEQTQGQQVSEATMWRAMRRLGWTHKKKRSSRANGMRKRVRPGVSR